MKHSFRRQPQRCLVAAALAIAVTFSGMADAKESSAAGASDHTAAQWVARMNAALNPGKSMTATLEIQTRWAPDDETGLIADLKRLSNEEGERTLIEIREPEAARGAAFEILRRPDGSLERWVWQPYVRRLRRIAGVQRTDPFLGTEFNYEDLGFSAPLERGAGEVHEVQEGGRTLVRLDSPPYHYYSRVVTLIDPSTSLPVHVTFFDGAGQRFREQSFEEVRTIGGHPMPTRIRMRDLVTGAESLLTLRDVNLDGPLKATIFQESQIRRRIPR